MRRTGTIGALVLLAALATGCSEDDTSAGGGGSAEETSAAGAANADAGPPVFCDLVTVDDLTAAVGAAVTTSTGPFDACEFDQDDPRALSGSLGAVDTQDNGGYEAYQSGTRSSLDTPARHDVAGIGDAAYVDIGSFAGGDNLQVAGGVLVGEQIYTLNLTQGVGLSEDELVATSERLLRLMVEAAA